MWNAHNSAGSARLSVRLSKWPCPKMLQVVKVICHMAHRRRRRMVQCYSTGNGVSSHEGTLAPPGEYDWTCASFGPLKSTTETANGSVLPFLHSSRQKVPVLYMQWAPLSTRIAPSHGGSEPHVIHGSLSPPESRTQTATRSLQPFLQGSLVWQTDRRTDHATRSVTVA